MDPKERPSWGVAHILAEGHDQATCPDLACAQLWATTHAIQADKLHLAAEKHERMAQARAAAAWERARALTKELKARRELADLKETK